MSEQEPRHFVDLAARLYPSRAGKLASYPRKILTTAADLPGSLRLNHRDIDTGRYHILLYRFLADRIPVVAACIWTWARLTAAPGKFVLDTGPGGSDSRAAEKILDCLTNRLYTSPTGQQLGLSGLLTEVMPMLYRDGMIGGFLTVNPDGSAVDRFLPVDPLYCHYDSDDGPPRLYYEAEEHLVDLNRPDFSHIALTDGAGSPLGRSILHAVPFVAYIEQQMVDDMRKASHNAGFNRLHVRITPPERIGGESDQAYTDRINSYFDATMEMIRSCETDDNPVTWDNVEIDYIGPDKSREVTNSWFMTHRAMIEEICAGTNLAPFLLGYSYGATTTWSDFKFDIVMRQVTSVQRQVASLLEWIADIELALHGIDCRARYVFDNTLAYQVADRVTVDSSRVQNLLKLFDAGLIDKSTAIEKAGRLI
jgi:hypothetical protein